MAGTAHASDVASARELLATAMAPVGEASALPFAAYRDEALFALETERLFRGDWVAVCAEAALAGPGDCLAVDVGGEPVALVRGADGQLRALSNVCRHRGTLMLEPGADRLEDGRIVCPYHAWSYSDAGAFRGAPYARGADIRPGGARPAVLPRRDLDGRRLRVPFGGDAAAGGAADGHRAPPRRLRHGGVHDGGAARRARGLGRQLES